MVSTKISRSILENCNLSVRSSVRDFLQTGPDTAPVRLLPPSNVERRIHFPLQACAAPFPPEELPSFRVTFVYPLRHVGSSRECLFVRVWRLVLIALKKTTRTLFVFSWSVTSFCWLNMPSRGTYY